MIRVAGGTKLVPTVGWVGRMKSLATLICIGFVALASPVCWGQQIKVAYIAGTLDVARNAAGKLDYSDERVCTINWANGAKLTQFSYEGVAFIEKGNLRLKGVYELVSLVNKESEFVTIAYADDWGQAHLLELRLKSDGRSFLERLGSRSHRAINTGPVDTSPLGSTLGPILGESVHSLAVRSSTWSGIRGGAQAKLSLSTGGLAVVESNTDKLELEYASIISMEYGEKVSAGLVRAVILSAVTMNELPFFLMRKKHKHFLTIAYIDAQGSTQVVQVEIPKYRARMLILEVELRSGKKVMYESEQAARDVYG